jgi:carboxypeptidase C (cathepsin A)
MADTANSPATAAPAADTPDKQLRQRVDRLLAQPAATSSGQLSLGKRKLAYTTAVEFMPVSAEGLEGVQNEPQGAVMTTAYLAKDADPAQRPVCFTFNGGPGSCSIWLQFGAVGPKRITTPADGSMPAPPYALQDNP